MLWKIPWGFGGRADLSLGSFFGLWGDTSQGRMASSVNSGITDCCTATFLASGRAAVCQVSTKRINGSTRLGKEEEEEEGGRRRREEERGGRKGEEMTLIHYLQEQCSSRHGV